MFPLLILVLIIFAVVQRRRYQRLDRYGCERWARKWERWNCGADSINWRTDKWDKWNRQWQEWEQWAQDAQKQAVTIEQKLARKIARAEDRIRQEAERLRRYAAASTRPPAPQTPRSGPIPSSNSALGPDKAAQQERFASEEQRRAYLRARKRAAREAGFYVHLMWYGIVIGACLLVNLLTTPHFEWWLFPALGWGIGLFSHWSAVFGWRWIHDRVFEPAVQREVRREVTLEKEAMRTEKQASLDELTASFAHEIRNPIAAAKSLVQQMGEDPTSSENVEYAKVAIDELGRVERSVSHLLKYAKEEDYHFDNVNLAAVVDAAIAQMRGKLEAKSVTVSRNYIGGPGVRGDADKLRQVFTNVIDNAIDAMDSNSGERRLEIGIHTLRSGMATVVLRDNGCGIAEDKLAKIFNPFYTTKANGTGLGMGIAKKVIDAHNGKIELHSQPGVGTQIQISIPIANGIRMPDGGRRAPELNHRDVAPAQNESSRDDGDYQLRFGAGNGR